MKDAEREGREAGEEFRAREVREMWEDMWRVIAGGMDIPERYLVYSDANV